MSWAIVAGAAISTVGGSMLSKGGGGGSGGGNAPPVYQPKDQPGRDDNFLWAQNAYGNNLQNMNQQVDPRNYQLMNSQFNSPYNDWLQNNATAAGQMSGYNAGRDQNAAQSMFNNADQMSAQYRTAMGNYDAMNSNVLGAANTMFGMGNQSNARYGNLMGYQDAQRGNVEGSAQNLYGGGNRVMNTAFDPQNALYDRTAHQLVDQTRAAEYARGIQMSPAGASVEAGAMSNFNIDWQNQQLARQSQGLQAAQGAYGAGQGMNNSYVNNLSGLQTAKDQNYSNLASGAANMVGNWNQSMGSTSNGFSNAIAGQYGGSASMGNQAAQQMYNQGALPYQASQTIYGNQNQGLQNYWQNSAPYMDGLNQLQSNDLGYMYQAQGAQNQGFSQNMRNKQFTNDMFSQMGQGGAMQNVGNQVRSWFPSSGGNNWADPSQYQSVQAPDYGVYF